MAIFRHFEKRNLSEMPLGEVAEAISHAHSIDPEGALLCGDYEGDVWLHWGRDMSPEEKAAAIEKREREQKRQEAANAVFMPLLARAVKRLNAESD